MLTVHSDVLELRGIMNQQSKAGKAYYIIHCETDAGEPHQLYCPDFNALPQGLKKGDLIKVSFEIHRYKTNERLVVTKVERAC